MIDTVEDKVLANETIPDMAVGTGVAVSPKHQKLYVGRGNFPAAGSSPGGNRTPLSIIDLRSRRELVIHELKTSVGEVVTHARRRLRVGRERQRDFDY